MSAQDHSGAREMDAGREAKCTPGQFELDAALEAIEAIKHERDALHNKAHNAIRQRDAAIEGLRAAERFIHHLGGPMAAEAHAQVCAAIAKAQGGAA